MNTLNLDPSTDDCVAILHHLVSERDPWRRDLMLADLASRITTLDVGYADLLREVAVSSSLPGQNLLVPSPTTERRSQAPRKVDIVITTVTPTEERAAIDIFDIDENEFELHHGRRFYEFKLSAEKCGRDVSIVLTSTNGPLNVPAAKAMFNIRDHFEASVYVLLGIAAGRKGAVDLGDVVLPDMVHYYEPGKKYANREDRRPKFHPMHSDIGNNLTYFYPEGASKCAEKIRDHRETVAKRDRPRTGDPGRAVKFVTTKATVASGEKLLQDNLLNRLSKFDSQILVGDQESFGFAEALEGKRWAIFRGVSDFGTKKKTNDWQYLAASGAAITLRSFLEDALTLEDSAF